MCEVLMWSGARCVVLALRPSVLHECALRSDSVNANPFKNDEPKEVWCLPGNVGINVRCVSVVMCGVIVGDGKFAA